MQANAWFLLLAWPRADVLAAAWWWCQGELVLLMQPDGPLPLAEWNTPWEEMVLVRGPDVMFDVVDLDPSDDIIEVRPLSSCHSQAGRQTD